MTAVAAGVVLGVIGLIVLAAVLASIGNGFGTWLAGAAFGLCVLGVIELQNLRRRHRQG